MPSGRDSFRRNRVAPSVLSYFTTLALGRTPLKGFAHCLLKRPRFRRRIILGIVNLVLHAAQAHCYTETYPTLTPFASRVPLTPRSLEVR